MKSLFKYLLCASVAITVMSCGSKDSDYEIHDDIVLPRCLQPVEVKATVENVSVTFSWKVFADAESYGLEIYSAIPEEGAEPDASALIASLEVLPSEVPYVWTGPAETKCWFRVRALSSERESSLWSSGKFTTATDPTKVCTAPANLAADVSVQKVSYSWTTYPDAEYYEFEIYSEPIPSGGDPDAGDLIEKLNVTGNDLPIVRSYPAATSVYFRVRGVNPTLNLTPSKWVTGSCRTADSAWPTDPTAITTYLNIPKLGYEYLGLSGKTSLTEDLVVNNITFGAKLYISDVYIALQTGVAKDTSFGAEKWIPTNKHISFKICSPGTLTLTFRKCLRPFTVALKTNKDGAEDVTWVYTETDFESTDARVIQISEAVLSGITQSATVYIFATNDASGELSPNSFTWAPAD